MYSGLIREFEDLLGPSSVLYRPEDLLLYEYDGSIEKGRPNVVVFPTTTEHVSRIVKLSAEHHFPIVGRGAGTGLSGGALARTGGVMLVFARMNRIFELDVENQRATVEPGVVNYELTRAAEAHGLYFAPDPSSWKSCTIGGNVAENAGGPHTLAYSVTTNHVTALEVVLPDGEVLRVGSTHGDAPGYDLTGLFVGSEGTLALVTEITVKLSRKPEAVKTLLAIFESVDDAADTVVDITARAITPAACEMLDGWTLRAVEDYIHAGFPRDSAAVLLIEVEGLAETVAAQAAAITEFSTPLRPPNFGPQQLRPRRCDPAFQTSPGFAPHPSNRRSILLSNRQYFPRRRRQPASHCALRSPRQKTIRTRPSGSRRNHP